MKTVIFNVVLFNVDGFSWKTIAGYHIPFIERLVNGKHLKFVATRMAEYELLKKYLHNIHSSIYTSCISVIAYVITDSEAKILNFINETYYGNGKDFQFLAGIDYIVRLEDIHNFYLFIDICYKKLHSNNTSCYNDKCGFVCVDFDLCSCVPYCTQNGQKYLPLFYFERYTENLIQQAVKLENWNLAYLKFCCKIHGIKAEYFTGDSCLVVSLDDIKNLYPPETHFEDFWPTKMAKLHLSRALSNPPGSWYRVVPKVVPDQNTIHHTLIAPVPIIPHRTQMMEDQMVCVMYSVNLNSFYIFGSLKNLLHVSFTMYSNKFIYQLIIIYFKPDK